MANSTTTTEEQKVPSKLHTLDDTVKAFIDQMDSSMVPEISDGMSYTDESYDITWNIDNIFLFGRTLTYLHAQRDKKQTYLNGLENSQMVHESKYGDDAIQRVICG